MSLGNGVRRRRTAAEWDELIGVYERGGLTQREFCEHNCVASSSFYKALSRYRSKGAALATKTTAADFIAVDVPSPDSSSWEVELQLGASIVLRMRGV
jgi:hypothetical protein